MNKVCRFPRTTALAVWFLLSAASPYEKAIQLYENGEFLMAASVAEEADTASSLALRSCRSAKLPFPRQRRVHGI